METERRDTHTRTTRLDRERQLVAGWLQRSGSTLSGQDFDALVHRIAEENIQIMFRRDRFAG